MYSKIISFCLLAAILFGCAVQETQATSTNVKLHVFGSSSIWWVAVAPQDDSSATTKVELKDASSSSYVTMSLTSGWGYYTYTSTSGSGFKVPLTIRLTSSSGAQITTTLSGIVPDAVVDTGLTFSGAASSPVTPTAQATTAPTSAPTTAPTTKPTSAPTAKATAAPTTAPTAKATVAPTASSSDLCSVTSTASEPVKLLVPLYVYPGAAWDSLIAAAASVKIIAIINPNSGPLSTVDSSYSTYMTKLANAGIEMVGYVHTTYGTRAIADVEADIDLWASKYPLITGIFFDEASGDASEISYYTTAYNYVIAKSGYSEVILNPGVVPDSGYLAISTNIVVYENYASSLASTSFSSFVKCAPSASAKAGYKYKFSGIVHTAASGSLTSYVNSLAASGMGLVYVTDGVGGCCTYNALTSYFAVEATAVAALNA